VPEIGLSKGSEFRAARSAGIAMHSRKPIKHGVNCIGK